MDRSGECQRRFATIIPHGGGVLRKIRARKPRPDEGQALLWSVGIHPIFGMENLVWAPNRVKDQHSVETLTEIIEALRDVKRTAKTPSDAKRLVKRALKKQGKTASQRK